MAKTYWSSVAVSTPRDQAAVLSWFAPITKPDWKAYKAEVLSDVETEDTKKFRVFVEDSKGKRFCLERRCGKRTTTISRKPVK